MSCTYYVIIFGSSQKEKNLLFSICAKRLSPIFIIFQDIGRVIKVRHMIKVRYFTYTVPVVNTTTARAHFVSSFQQAVRVICALSSGQSGSSAVHSTRPKTASAASSQRQNPALSKEPKKRGLQTQLLADDVGVPIAGKKNKKKNWIGKASGVWRVNITVLCRKFVREN